MVFTAFRKSNDIYVKSMCPKGVMMAVLDVDELEFSEMPLPNLW
jgi:hypothetical protein